MQLQKKPTVLNGKILLSNKNSPKITIQGSEDIPKQKFLEKEKEGPIVGGKQTTVYKIRDPLHKDRTMLKIIEPKIPVRKSHDFDSTKIDIDTALETFSNSKIDFGDKEKFAFDDCKRGWQSISQCLSPTYNHSQLQRVVKRLSSEKSEKEEAARKKKSKKGGKNRMKKALLTLKKDGSKSKLRVDENVYKSIMGNYSKDWSIQSKGNN